MLNKRESAAREAAERLEAAREVGAQLVLLPSEASPADPSEIVPRGPGRPAGSRNKRTSKLRQMLAARGYRMPEDVVAETAGLTARGVTGVELAMQRAEQVAAWLEADTGIPLKRDQRLGLFVAIFKEQNGAASALLPYGLEKLTPDSAPMQSTVIMMPGAGDPAARARTIEGSAASDQGARPMPKGMQEYQRIRGALANASDGGIRTDEASD